MKPTKLQKELAKIVQLQGSFWECTNDINSPTHSCDIDEELNKLSIDHPELTDKYITTLSNVLHSLWNLIAKVNE